MIANVSDARRCKLCTTALNIYELGGEASPLNDVLKAFYRMAIRAYDGRMSVVTRAELATVHGSRFAVCGASSDHALHGRLHAICALKLPIPW